jgi:hypothetical protein
MGTDKTWFTALLETIFALPDVSNANFYSKTPTLSLSWHPNVDLIFRNLFRTKTRRGKQKPKQKKVAQSGPLTLWYASCIIFWCFYKLLFFACTLLIIDERNSATKKRSRKSITLGPKDETIKPGNDRMRNCDTYQNCVLISRCYLLYIFLS